MEEDWRHLAAQRTIPTANKHLDEEDFLNDRCSEAMVLALTGSGQTRPRSHTHSGPTMLRLSTQHYTGHPQRKRGFEDSVGCDAVDSSGGRAAGTSISRVEGTLERKKNGKSFAKRNFMNSAQVRYHLFPACASSPQGCSTPLEPKHTGSAAG